MQSNYIKSYNSLAAPQCQFAMQSNYIILDLITVWQHLTVTLQCNPFRLSSYLVTKVGPLAHPQGAKQGSWGSNQTEKNH
jgi:hypothetical protein